MVLKRGGLKSVTFEGKPSFLAFCLDKESARFPEASTNKSKNNG